MFQKILGFSVLSTTGIFCMVSSYAVHCDGHRIFSFFLFGLTYLFMLVAGAVLISKD